MQMHSRPIKTRKDKVEGEVFPAKSRIKFGRRSFDDGVLSHTYSILNIYVCIYTYRIDKTGASKWGMGDEGTNKGERKMGSKVRKLSYAKRGEEKFSYFWHFYMRTTRVLKMSIDRRRDWNLKAPTRLRICSFLLFFFGRRRPHTTRRRFFV